MTRHILLAYGREVDYRRATFAAISFWAWYTGEKSDVQTVIFTDNPAFFKAHLNELPVDYQLITRPQLDEMIGPLGYIHRIKIVIIDVVFQKFPADNILFCDADTFFIADPQALLNSIQVGTSFMHKAEWALSKTTSRMATREPENPRRFLQETNFRTYQIGTEEFQFDKKQVMWNSGVLGLAPKVASLIPDVYALNDSIFGFSKWDLTEQVAFSLVLQAKSTLLPSSQYVVHYWNWVMRMVIDKLVNEYIIQKPGSNISLARLTEIRSYTTNWPQYAKKEKPRLETLIAFSIRNNHWVLSGLKGIKNTILAGAFNATFLKDVFFALAKHGTHKKV